MGYIRIRNFICLKLKELAFSDLAKNELAYFSHDLFVTLFFSSPSAG